MAKDKNKIEIEIQVQIENSKNLINFLIENGKFSTEKHQIDKYFVPAHRNFVSVRPVDEWLRLRDSSGTYSINYKFWYRDEAGRSHHCDEFETTGGDLKQLEKIFEALNMKLLVEVDKTRKSWLYENYEISIDTIKGLGDFVEIEYKGETDQPPAEITKEMIVFLKQFEPGKITRNYVGYPFQLLFPNEVKTEEY